MRGTEPSRPVACRRAARGVRLRAPAGAHRPGPGRAPRRGPDCSSTGGRGARAPRRRPARPAPRRRRRRRQRDPRDPRPPAAPPGDRRRRRGAAARAARRRAAHVGGAGAPGAQAACRRGLLDAGRDRSLGSADARRPATRSTSCCSAATIRWSCSAGIGEMPLPPYITTRLDRPDRYQTVYATGRGRPPRRPPDCTSRPTLLDGMRAAGSPSPGRARRRAGHVPAGHRHRPARAPHAQRALPGARRRRGRRARRAGGRRRRHDQRAGAGERRGDRAARRAHRLFIHRASSSGSSTCCSPTSTCRGRRC